MHRRSKSTPKPIEFIDQIFGNSNKRGSIKFKVIPQPPEQHHHKEKNYVQCSPIRNRKKLIEARKFLSPLVENKITTKPKVEVIDFINKKSNKEKLFTKNLFKNCLKNIKKLKISEYPSENNNYFTAQEKNEACMQYTIVQRKISTLSKLRNKKRIY